MEKNSMTDATINLIKSQDRKGIFILDGWVKEFAYNLRGKPDTDMRLFLSQLLYWFEPRGRSEATGEVQHRANLVRGGDTWVVKSIDEWCEELGLTLRVFRRLLKDLEDIRLIKKETHIFRGMRCLHVTFNWDRLDYYMHKYTQTAGLPGCDDSELEVVETKSNASKNKPKKAKRSTNSGSKSSKSKVTSSNGPKLPEATLQSDVKSFSYSTEIYYRDLEQKPHRTIDRETLSPSAPGSSLSVNRVMFDESVEVGSNLFGDPGFEDSDLGRKLKRTMRRCIQFKTINPGLMEALNEIDTAGLSGEEFPWPRWSNFIFDMNSDLSVLAYYLNLALNNSECSDYIKNLISDYKPRADKHPEYYEIMEAEECSRI